MALTQMQSVIEKERDGKMVQFVEILHGPRGILKHKYTYRLPNGTLQVLYDVFSPHPNKPFLLARGVPENQLTFLVDDA